LFLIGTKLLHEHAEHPQLKADTFFAVQYSPVQSINQLHVKSLHRCSCYLWAS